MCVCLCLCVLVLIIRSHLFTEGLCNRNTIIDINNWNGHWIVWPVTERYVIIYIYMKFAGNKENYSYLVWWRRLFDGVKTVWMWCWNITIGLYLSVFRLHEKCQPWNSLNIMPIEVYSFETTVHFYKSKETDDKTKRKRKKIPKEQIYKKYGKYICNVTLQAHSDIFHLCH